MRYGIKTINNYNNVNSFSYSSEWMIRAGDTKTLYFQIVDLDSQDQIRQMIDPSATVTVSFPNVGSDPIVKTAIQADPLDSSIWAISILSTDAISTGAVFIEIIQGGVSSKFGVSQAINVESSGLEQLNWGGC